MHTELIIAKLVIIILGFIIAGQAYRSYRRGNGQPVLFVAIGFVFIRMTIVGEEFYDRLVGGI